MVLDLPDVVDAESVGELDLVERVLIEKQLGIQASGLRQLVLVENPEFHRPAFLPVRTGLRRWAGLLGRACVKCD
jgi:hypothetical protein